MSDQYDRLRDIVDAWRIKRAELVESEPYDNGGNARMVWLRDLGSVHDTLTRHLVRELGDQSPEFWNALRDLAGNAHRVIRGDTVWEQLKFWVRDFRDSFGHAGASDKWADELRQIRGDMGRPDDKHGSPPVRRKFGRDRSRSRSGEIG